MPHHAAAAHVQCANLPPCSIAKFFAVYSPHPASGALPARFRRHRILIVGCGDVGTRLLGRLQPVLKRVRVLTLCHEAAHARRLRAMGVQVLSGDLDQPLTLQRLAGLAQRVLHLAPPTSQNTHWWRDLRTQALLHALRRRTPPQHLVYGSTSGVYGDQGGAWVAETTPIRPHTPRAHRRVDAEKLLRHWGKSSIAGGAPVRVSVLRIPGIYALDRAGGNPRERLLRHTPVLARADDVYTNHIHADDLARACWLALWRGKPQRLYNANDNSAMKMGDYFDLAASMYQLPKPPRLPRHAAENELPLYLLSFMQESRRMHNARIQRELRWQPRYPTPHEGLHPKLQRELF